jgi:hypothetical protein
MDSDRGINQITAKRTQSRQSPVLVGASEPPVSDHVRGEDCYKLAGLDHGTLCALAIVA